MEINKIKDSIRTVVTMGLLGAILLAVQVGLAVLPNVELVTPLILIYTLVYRKKVFYAIYVFVLMEGLIYGFGIWWVSYLYIWSILAVVVLIFSKNQSVILWAVISAAYGLAFGFLCAFPYFLSGGIGAGLAYWAAGIPFDIIHCVSNFVVTLIVFKPVHTLLKKLALDAKCN